MRIADGLDRSHTQQVRVSMQRTAACAHPRGERHRTDRRHLGRAKEERSVRSVFLSTKHASNELPDRSPAAIVIQGMARRRHAAWKPG